MSFTIHGGSVCVLGRGFFADAIVERHFEDLRRAVQAARTGHHRFDVLVDMREAAIQAPATTARIEAETRRLWSADDRIAIVVRTGLGKIQMTRILDDSNHQVFDTMDAAQRWLDAGPRREAEPASGA